jgi:hypothetical protein
LSVRRSLICSAICLSALTAQSARAPTGQRLVVHVSVFNTGGGLWAILDSGGIMPTVEDFRLAQVALGITLHRGVGVAARAEACLLFPAIYREYGFGLGLGSIGGGVFVRAPAMPRPAQSVIQACVLYGEDPHGIGIADGLPPHLDLMVCGSATFWAANPELELRWRRRFRPDRSTDPHRHFDSVSLLLRIGLGGWMAF